MFIHFPFNQPPQFGCWSYTSIVWKKLHHPAPWHRSRTRTRPFRGAVPARFFRRELRQGLRILEAPGDETGNGLGSNDQTSNQTTMATTVATTHWLTIVWQRPMGLRSQIDQSNHWLLCLPMTMHSQMAVGQLEGTPVARFSQQCFGQAPNFQLL